MQFCWAMSSQAYTHVTEMVGAVLRLKELWKLEEGGWCLDRCPWVRMREGA